jgi:hypothetical protein
MTTPKKPARRSALTKSVASDAPPPDLTPAEQSLLRSFRAMDDEARDFVDKVALGQARLWPRRVAPSLRLVVGRTG